MYKSQKGLPTLRGTLENAGVLQNLRKYRAHLLPHDLLRDVVVQHQIQLELPLPHQGDGGGGCPISVRPGSLSSTCAG